jgi:integrase
MATVKIKFHASSVKFKEGSLSFQITHKRVVRQIHTGYKLFPTEWNKRYATVIHSNEMDKSRRSYLVALEENIRDETEKLTKIITQFTSTGTAFTSDNIVESYRHLTQTGGFLSFIQNHISHLAKVGRLSASEKLHSTFNSFMDFHGAKEMLFHEINTDVMEEYEGFLKNKGICMNTVSFYMRTLRSVYNVAVERRLTVQNYPFKYVYTGIDKTMKRAIPLKTIRQIRNLDLTGCPTMQFARDIFMFSFYTRGMSFVDMAFLKKRDLQNGFLTYRRHKTNQQLTIKWEKPMQEIIERYRIEGIPYLLPIIKNTQADERRQYKNAIHLVNNKLKQLGREIGLDIPLTTYVARHGWASIAKCKNIPTTTISEALGHDSERTTRIYLASLDTSAVDKANRQILESI